MIKIKKQLYEDMYHPIFSQEVNNQRISIILIPPARPLLMTSKGMATLSHKNSIYAPSI